MIRPRQIGDLIVTSGGRLARAVEELTIDGVDGLLYRPLNRRERLLARIRREKPVAPR